MPEPKLSKQELQRFTDHLGHLGGVEGKKAAIFAVDLYKAGELKTFWNARKAQLNIDMGKRPSGKETLICTAQCTPFLATGGYKEYSLCVLACLLEKLLKSRTDKRRRRS